MRKLKIVSILAMAFVMLAIIPMQIFATNTPITLQQIADKINSSNYGEYLLARYGEDLDELSEDVVMQINAEVQGNRIIMNGSLGFESNPNQIESDGVTVELRGNILHVRYVFQPDSLQEMDGKLDEFGRTTLFN